MNGGVVRRSGGRPTAEAAAALEAKILDSATASFLAEGYADTTIEAIARACNVAKRTIYARWNGKPALFHAVLQRLMAKWLSGAGNWTESDRLEPALDIAASHILDVAMTPEAVSLQRLLIAESARFPELPLMMSEAGSSEGVVRIAALLDRAVTQGELPPQDTGFAAEQFLHLVVTGPQRRALGLGQAMDAQQLRDWRKATVALFLAGIRR